MSGIEVSCPICQLVFVTDRSYVDHLADAHDLLDDEGTTTTVADAAAAAPNDAALRAAAALALAPEEEPPSIDPSRVYDPDAHNPYRPAVAALVILALLLGGGLTAFRAFTGGDGDAVAAETPSTEVDTLFADVADTKGGASGSTAPSAPETTPTTAAPTTAVPETTVPPAPAPARRPAPAPAPAPAPPPAPPAVFAPPTVTGLRLDTCPANRGNGGVWRFSYLLAGGANWTANPAATLIGDRYYESRDTRYRDIAVTQIVVVNALTGAAFAIDVPDLTEANCP